MDKNNYFPHVVTVVTCLPNDEVKLTLSPSDFGRYLVIFEPLPDVIND